MQTNTINGITKQYKLDKLLIDADVKNWRGSPRKTFSVDDLNKIDKMYKKQKKQNEIAAELGTNRSAFRAIRLNKNHPNHIALINIFGEVRPRQRHKPLKQDLEQQTIEKGSALNDELQFQAEMHYGYLMKSEMSELNAQDKIVAEKYANLRKMLRLYDVDDPMYLHAKTLYDDVVQSLLEVTRKIYDEQQQNQSIKKPQDQKNS